MTELPRAASIVIIGAGAVGAATAYALARDGHDVLVLDRGAVGQGASAGTACMVTVSHAERMASPAALAEGIRFLPDPAGPLSLRPRPATLPWLARFTAASLRRGDADAGTALLRRLAREAVDLHRCWAEEHGTGLVQQGTLNAYLTEDGLEQRDETARELGAAGLEVTLLDRAEVAEAEPALRGAHGGALYPGDAHVDSLVFAQRVAEAARARGAVFAEGIEVLRVLREPTTLRLDTTAGSLAAERIVLAAGVWSRRLAADIGAILPIEGAKGYHVEYAGAGVRLRRPVFMAERRVVATPLDGRLRLAGTLELGTDPERVDPRRVEAVTRAGTEHIEGLAGSRVTHVWRGLRPMSADGMPIVGPSPGDERVLIATGHGMLGITLAPVTAEHVASLARGDALPHDLDALRPDRFRRLPLPRRQ
jgi:D-amino-acid dehydrogenase